MPERLSIKRAYEPVEIDLWAEDGGALFLTRPITRSVQQQIGEVEDKLEALAREGREAAERGEPVDENAAEDRRVALLAEMVQARLTTPDGAKPSKAKTAKAIIVRKWEADELSPDELIGLIDQISEADGRPT
jgi:hypothetical protein